MHRNSKKVFDDPPTEGWFNSLVIKPGFKTVVMECRDRLRSERKKEVREEIIRKYADRIIKQFSLRKRNFMPLVEEYLETGMIMLNPFELYGVTLVNAKNSMSFKIHPGIRKETLHRAVDLWWDKIDWKMSIINSVEHKKQYKTVKNIERNVKIYELYLKGIIKYNGKLKKGLTLADIKQYGIDSLPGIDMRKKIIVRMRNNKKI